MADFKRVTRLSGEVLIEDVAAGTRFREGSPIYAAEEYARRIAEGATQEEVSIGPPPPYAKVHVSAVIFDGAKDVIATDWEELGGAVIDPHYFATDPNHEFVRVIFAYKIAGSLQAEFRITETHGGVERDLLAAPATLPGTGGVLTSKVVNTDQPLYSGDNIYTIYAKVTTATTVRLKNMNAALMEAFFPQE